MRAFLNDMQEKNGLCMFNTYLSQASTWTDEKILAIDAGGTNLRFTEVKNGKKLSEKKMSMLGIAKEITADEFFDQMAELIAPYECKKIGFCFSYPARLLPNNDAVITEFSKEVKITGAEGKAIGEEINKRLKEKREFFVLNDTVACSLGVGADIGLILGTGFNICYFDKNLGSIVNTETGRFGDFALGNFDKALMEEKGSENVLLERQISGAYLGRLIEITARAYFVKDIPAFELKDVSMFFIGEGVLYDYFSGDEKIEFREIVNLLLDRAADRVAMCVECFSKGEENISIGIEGSTIYKLPGYYEKVTEAIRRIEGTKFGFYDARNTISIGTARACK